MHDLVLGDDTLLFLVDTPFREDRIEAVFCLFLAVAQGSRLLEILSLDGRLFVHTDLLNLRLDVLHVWRSRHCRDSRT